MSNTNQVTESQEDKNKRFAKILGLDTFSLESFSIKSTSKIYNTNNSNKDNKRDPNEPKKRGRKKLQRIYPSDTQPDNSLMWRKIHDDPTFQTVINWGFCAKTLLKRCLDIGFDAVKQACHLTITKPDSYFRQGLEVCKQRIYVLAGTIRNMLAAKLDPDGQEAKAQKQAAPQPVAPVKPVAEPGKPLYYYPTQDPETEEEEIAIADPVYAQVVELVVKKVHSPVLQAAYKCLNVVKIDRERFEAKAIGPLMDLLKKSPLEPLYEALETVLGSKPIVCLSSS
jgi:hypothetical protein